MQKKDKTICSTVKHYHHSLASVNTEAKLCFANTCEKAEKAIETKIRSYAIIGSDEPDFSIIFHLFIKYTFKFLWADTQIYEKKRSWASQHLRWMRKQSDRYSIESKTRKKAKKFYTVLKNLTGFWLKIKNSKSFQKNSISQTFPDVLQHGRKNPHEHSIESETRMKKPEIWNFIKNYYW